MDLAGWDERYRAPHAADSPTPVLVEIARHLKPAKALDLACGTGRNALWLAEHGWQVTAVDGSTAAIGALRQHASERGLEIDSRVADFESREYRLEPSQWDFIAVCYYLQRDLIESILSAAAPGGVVLIIVHITEPGEEPTRHRLRPGELRDRFQGWEILHDYEGPPRDASHRRLVAEIAAHRVS